jgi:uncharacterized membrane protein
MNPSSGAAIAVMIGVIVATATAGDVLIASAMRRTGKIDRTKVVYLTIGTAFMALSFFALLFSLSHADVSLIAPAAGSLTFVANAVAAKWVLRENVDRRRWLAAVFVCCGVALLKR